MVLIKDWFPGMNENTCLTNFISAIDISVLKQAF